ncbi:unnamed protein product [Paramecium sonneborni]|uniref:Uncharacterized protein n=1 Tax=Paramecium sonneborni TaxID=65129 RepID=A0A8S1RKF6_9CILI|nr:unnamed protein product [Paramecium sonneborni]
MILSKYFTLCWLAIYDNQFNLSKFTILYTYFKQFTINHLHKNSHSNHIKNIQELPLYVDYDVQILYYLQSINNVEIQELLFYDQLNLLLKMNNNYLLMNLDCLCLNQTTTKKLQLFQCSNEYFIPNDVEYLELWRFRKIDFKYILISSHNQHTSQRHQFKRMQKLNQKQQRIIFGSIYEN